MKPLSRRARSPWNRQAERYKATQLSSTCGGPGISYIGCQPSAKRGAVEIPWENIHTAEIAPPELPGGHGIGFTPRSGRLLVSPPLTLRKLTAKQLHYWRAPIYSSADHGEGCGTNFSASILRITYRGSRLTAAEHLAVNRGQRQASSSCALHVDLHAQERPIWLSHNFDEMMNEKSIFRCTSGPTNPAEQPATHRRHSVLGGMMADLIKASLLVF